MKTFFSIALLLTCFFAPAQTIKVEAESFLNQSGIQINTVDDDGVTGKAVGYWNNRDFIIFNLTAPKAGIYNFIFRIACGIDGAQYEVRDEAEKVLAVINPPNTGSFNSFVDVTAAVNLKAGKQTIKYICVSNNIGADINWFKYSFTRTFGSPIITMMQDTVITITDAAKTVTVKINSAAVDEDGTITAYQWKKTWKIQTR